MGKAKELQEVLDTELDGRDEIVLRLEKAYALKIQVGEKPDKDKEGSGLLKELEDIKDALAIFQLNNNLDGIRHNKLVFVNRWQDGKKTFDSEKFFQELLSHGVKAEVIQEAAQAATGQGAGFYVKELKLLK